MIQVAYAVIWWLAILVIGLITFPLVSRVCNRLPDKGYSISKILGLLLVTYFSWLLSSAHILKFGYVNVSISLLLLIVISLSLGRKYLTRKDLPWKSMVISEAVFSAAFVLFLIFLVYRPDIDPLSEDFMDFAFMQSILRTDYFPPHDPWLAGNNILYYYGGHMVSAVLVMISRVSPAIAYNLAIAMFFALALSASYGLGYNLTRRKLYGFVTVIFVCIAGWLSGVFQLAAYFLQHNIAGYSPVHAPNIIEWLRSADFVSANWLIKYAAIRNPFYSFSVGHLHADATDIPFQLMSIILVFALFKKSDSDSKITKWDLLLSVIVLALSLGFLSFVNMWSYPVYLVFAVLAFLLLRINIGKKSIIGIVALSLLLYLPYYIGRGTGGVNRIGVGGGRTELVEFLEVFPLFLFAMFSLFYVSFKGKLVRGEMLVVMAIFVIVVALVAFLLNFQLILVPAPLILVPLYFVYKARPKKETEFILLLILIGALIVLFCEIFFINDALPPPYKRFNTLAKFYIQIWIFWGIASAYAVFWVLRNTKGKLKAFWVSLLLVLVLASMVYPIGLIASWTSSEHNYFGINRGTLDGTAYVKTLALEDYESIQWINKHIKGSHVILEAPGVAYKFNSRISTMTGLPTVIGWQTHEVMWRNSWDKVAGRDTDVNTIYQTPDGDEAISLLRKYNVEYIYMGKLEKERYPAESLLKFASHPERYKLIYENQGAVIYQVMP